MAKRGRKTTQKPTSTTSRPPIPFYFTSDQSDIFEGVVDLLDSKGTLGDCDPTLIESYSLTLDLLRRAAKDIQENGIANTTSQGRGKNPACDTVLSCVQKLQIYTTKMGLNPSALNKMMGASSYRDDPDFDDVRDFLDD